MDISSVSRREVLRYLGYRGQAEPDRAVADEIEMCLGLLAEKAEDYVTQVFVRIENAKRV